MLDATLWGLLRVNMGADANRLDDLLTFMSNAILKRGQDIFGMQKPSKFNVPWWNGLAKELNARYREAVSHWNIVGRPRSCPLAELKCRARPVFRHEMKFLRENEDQLRSQTMLSKLRRGNAMIYGRKLKHSTLRRNPCHKQWNELLGKAILQTYGKIISVQKQILLAPLITKIGS